MKSSSDVAHSWRFATNHAHVLEYIYVARVADPGESTIAAMSRLAALAVLAIALAGCGGTSSDEQAASTLPSSPPTATVTTSWCLTFGNSTSPQKSFSTETLYLSHVALRSDDCLSTVSFELEPKAKVPGFEVSYQPADTAKVEDGSGDPVEIAGEAFLVVELKPAMTARIDGDRVTKTYTGKNRLPGTDPVTEVVKTGDFEGVVTWVIGLDRELPFSAEPRGNTVDVEIDSSEG